MSEVNVAFTSLGFESNDKSTQRRVKKTEGTASPSRPPFAMPTKPPPPPSECDDKPVVYDDYTKSHPFPELELPNEQNRYHRNSQTLDSTLIASGSPYRGRRSTAKSSQFSRSVDGMAAAEPSVTTPHTSDESAQQQASQEFPEDLPQQHSGSPSGNPRPLLKFQALSQQPHQRIRRSSGGQNSNTTGDGSATPQDGGPSTTRPAAGGGSAEGGLSCPDDLHIGTVTNLAISGYNHHHPLNNEYASQSAPSALGYLAFFSFPTDVPLSLVICGLVLLTFVLLCTGMQLIAGFVIGDVGSRLSVASLNSSAHNALGTFQDMVLAPLEDSITSIGIMMVMSQVECWPPASSTTASWINETTARCGDVMPMQLPVLPTTGDPSHVTERFRDLVADDRRGVWRLLNGSSGSQRRMAQFAANLGEPLSSLPPALQVAAAWYVHDADWIFPLLEIAAERLECSMRLPSPDQFDFDYDSYYGLSSTFPVDATSVQIAFPSGCSLSVWCAETYGAENNTTKMVGFSALILLPDGVNATFREVKRVNLKRRPGELLLSPEYFLEQYLKEAIVVVDNATWSADISRSLADITNGYRSSAVVNSTQSATERVWINTPQDVTKLDFCVLQWPCSPQSMLNDTKLFQSIQAARSGSNLLIRDFISASTPTNVRGMWASLPLAASERDVTERLVGCAGVPLRDGTTGAVGGKAMVCIQSTPLACKPLVPFLFRSDECGGTLGAILYDPVNNIALGEGMQQECSAEGGSATEMLESATIARTANHSVVQPFCFSSAHVHASNWNATSFVLGPLATVLLGETFTFDGTSSMAAVPTVTSTDEVVSSIGTLRNRSLSQDGNAWTLDKVFGVNVGELLAAEAVQAAATSMALPTVVDVRALTGRRDGAVSIAHLAPTVNWIIMHLREDEVLEAYKEKAILLAIGQSVVCFVFVVGGWLLLRLCLRPLREMRQYMKDEEQQLSKTVDRVHDDEETVELGDATPALPTTPPNRPNFGVNRNPLVFGDSGDKEQSQSLERRNPPVGGAAREVNSRWLDLLVLADISQAIEAYRNIRRISKEMLAVLRKFQEAIQLPHGGLLDSSQGIAKPGEGASRRGTNTTTTGRSTTITSSRTNETPENTMVISGTLPSAVQAGPASRDLPSPTARSDPAVRTDVRTQPHQQINAIHEVCDGDAKKEKKRTAEEETPPFSLVPKKGAILSITFPRDQLYEKLRHVPTAATTSHHRRQNSSATTSAVLATNAASTSNPSLFVKGQMHALRSAPDDNISASNSVVSIGSQLGTLNNTFAPHPSAVCFEYIGLVLKDIAECGGTVEHMDGHHTIVVSFGLVGGGEEDDDEQQGPVADTALRCALRIARTIHDLFFTALPEWMDLQAVDLHPSPLSPPVYLTLDYSVMFTGAVAALDHSEPLVLGDAIERFHLIHLLQKTRHPRCTLLIASSLSAQLVSADMLTLLVPVDVMSVCQTTGIPRTESFVVSTLIDPVSIAMGEGKTFAPQHDIGTAEAVSKRLHYLTSKEHVVPAHLQPEGGLSAFSPTIGATTLSSVATTVVHHASPSPPKFGLQGGEDYAAPLLTAISGHNSGAQRQGTPGGSFDSYHHSSPTAPPLYSVLDLLHVLFLGVPQETTFVALQPPVALGLVSLLQQIVHATEASSVSIAVGGTSSGVADDVLARLAEDGNRKLLQYPLFLSDVLHRSIPALQRGFEVMRSIGGNNNSTAGTNPSPSGQRRASAPGQLDVSGRATKLSAGGNNNNNLDVNDTTSYCSRDPLDCSTGEGSFNNDGMDLFPIAKKAVKASKPDRRSSVATGGGGDAVGSSLMCFPVIQRVSEHLPTMDSGTTLTLQPAPRLPYSVRLVDPSWEDVEDIVAIGGTLQSQ